MKRKISDLKNNKCLTSVGQGLAQMLIYEIRNGESPIVYTALYVIVILNIMCFHNSCFC